MAESPNMYLLIVAIVAGLGLAQIVLDSFEQPFETPFGKAIEFEKPCWTQEERCGASNSIMVCKEFKDGCCQAYIISSYCDPREPFCIEEEGTAYCSENPKTEVKPKAKVSPEQQSVKERDWVCDKWGPCISFIKKRDCVKASIEAKEEYKPETQKRCTPPPSCDDGILNQGEQKVDCGGPCPACPIEETCYDNIQNQGEEGVDCGGPCPACPSCYDGILNQGEIKIDCGGPCPACPELEQPAPQTPKQPLIWWIIIVVTALVFISGGIGFIYYEKKRSAEKLEKEKTNPSQKTLVALKDYVIREHQAGYKPQRIYNILKKEGWSKPALNKVFLQAKKEITVRKKTTVKRAKRKK